MGLLQVYWFLEFWAQFEKKKKVACNRFITNRESEISPSSHLLLGILMGSPARAAT